MRPQLRSLLLSLAIAAASPATFAADAAPNPEFKQAIEALQRGDEVEFRKRMGGLAEQNNVEARIFYGGFLASKGQFAEAERMLAGPATAGNAEAQYRLGSALLQQGPARGPEAAAWIGKAAAQGHADAADLVYMMQHPARSRGNLLSTDDLLAGLAAMKQLRNGRLGDKALACYRHTRESYAAATARLYPECTAAVRERYGPWINMNDNTGLAQDWDSCGTSAMLREKKISLSDLGICLRNAGL